MLNELKSKLNISKQQTINESFNGENADIRDMFLDDTGATVADDNDIEVLIEKIPEFDPAAVSDSDLEKISESFIPEEINGGE